MSAAVRPDAPGRRPGIRHRRHRGGPVTRVRLGEEESLNHVGSQWVSGTVDGSSHLHSPAMLFINWHTGAKKYVGTLFPATESELARFAAPERRDWDDLDSPRLLEPICPPMRRPLSSLGSEDVLFGMFAYASPFALTFGETDGRKPHEVLDLSRCGTRASEQLTVGGHGGSIQTGGGVVSWEGGFANSRAGAYVVRLTPHRDFGMDPFSTSCSDRANQRSSRRTPRTRCTRRSRSRSRRRRRRRGPSGRGRSPSAPASALS